MNASLTIDDLLAAKAKLDALMPPPREPLGKAGQECGACLRKTNVTITVGTGLAPGKTLTIAGRVVGHVCRECSDTLLALTTND